jgi:glyoxylase-like metal-dependent hydrolase (beta-lactamase superfamily II)
MSDSAQQFRVGAAMVTVINVGDFAWDQAAHLNVPESEWRPRYTELFDHPLLLPIQNIHIALPGISLLVDASLYDLTSTSLEYHPPAGYQAPPGLLAQMDAARISAEGVTHVVITHAHFDHYSATTLVHDGHMVPSFPNARYYLGRADWDDEGTQQELQDPASEVSRTLGALHANRALELVEDGRDLGNGVTLIAAPGETAGHHLVKLWSGDQALYCLGDLYHHPIEVEHPTWMARNRDEAANIRSRQTLTRAALAEDALHIATHIPGVGRLRKAEDGVMWAAT